ncbi:hypothetical protein A7M79_07410 [Acinetobacter baumannii]|nr:hypothetical protein A7M79_07410 [Acinetobacter baumannii]
MSLTKDNLSSFIFTAIWVNFILFMVITFTSGESISPTIKGVLYILSLLNIVALIGAVLLWFVNRNK